MRFRLLLPALLSALLLAALAAGLWAGAPGHPDTLTPPLRGSTSAWT